MLRLGCELFFSESPSRSQSWPWQSIRLVKSIWSHMEKTTRNYTQLEQSLRVNAQSLQRLVQKIKLTVLLLKGRENTLIECSSTNTGKLEKIHFESLVISPWLFIHHSVQPCMCAFSFLLSSFYSLPASIPPCLPSSLPPSLPRCLPPCPSLSLSHLMHIPPGGACRCFIHFLDELHPPKAPHPPPSPFSTPLLVSRRRQCVDAAEAGDVGVDAWWRHNVLGT